jgi:effector-binding domain-containing protein
MIETDHAQIKYAKTPEALVAIRRHTVQNRDDIRAALTALAEQIPEGLINGPAFCIFWFVTSVKDGFDVQVGFPVSDDFSSDAIQTQVFPAKEALYMIHQGTLEELRQSYNRLYGFAAEYGLISDEFRREVYHDGNDPAGKKIEIQFIVHNWNELLAENLERVFGEEIRQAVLAGLDPLDTRAKPDQRFEWVKEAIENLESQANEFQIYDVLSGCAHVFPAAQIDKLRQIYQKTHSETGDSLAAVDAVLDFMGEDPGWVERPERQDYTIYAKKNPRDPEAYAKAETSMEKRQAYCFCPLLRNAMDQGMPQRFCYCGAGWYRQQWDGATGKPVRIEIVKSVLQGDEVCQFAVHLDKEI